MMLQNLDKLYLAIFLFLIQYMLISYIRPDFIFDNNRDCLRQFGVGYKNTTVLTLWLTTILLAIMSYFMSIYILHMRNMWY